MSFYVFNTGHVVVTTLESGGTEEQLPHPEQLQAPTITATEPGEMIMENQAFSPPYTHPPYYHTHYYLCDCLIWGS